MILDVVKANCCNVSNLSKEKKKMFTKNIKNKKVMNQFQKRYNRKKDVPKQFLRGHFWSYLLLKYLLDTNPNRMIENHKVYTSELLPVQLPKSLTFLGKIG